MTKTTYVDVPSELEDLYNRTLQPGDRFTFPRIIRKTLFISRPRKRIIANRSWLKALSLDWKTLSPAQKQAWKEAGAIVGLTNWQAFISDMCSRIQGGFTGIEIPTTTHLSKVGLLRILAPANELKIEQHHPRNYYIKRLMTGTRRMFSPVLITESFGPPFKIGLSYKSNLSADGVNPYARFYATVYSSYQGEIYETELVNNLNLVQDWLKIDNTLSSVLGIPIWYKMVIHLHDVTGDLYVDQFVAEHSAQNWARDPRCKDIDEGFKRSFYQVGKHWIPEIIPSGAWFGSVYEDF